jgi:hypothetical protein
MSICGRTQSHPIPYESQGIAANKVQCTMHDAGSTMHVFCEQILEKAVHLSGYQHGKATQKMLKWKKWKISDWNGLGGPTGVPD